MQQENKGLNILIGIGIVLSPIIGIILGVIAIVDFENYFKPYLFAGVCGGLGLFVGVLFTIKIKPFVLERNKKIKDYSQLSMFMITGFIGLFLLIGVKTNTYLSELSLAENPIVVNKTYREGRYRQAGYNKLFFQLDGKVINVRCHKKYWDSIHIGQRIRIEVFKSKIGFDYIILPDERKASL